MEQKLKDYLRECRELAGLCTQNGWIDNDTLRIEIVDHSTAEITLNVQFEEIIMEGAGCVADRIPCYGKLRLRLDNNGEVEGVDFL